MSQTTFDLNRLPKESSSGPRTADADYAGELWTDKKLICPVVVRTSPIVLPRAIEFSRFEYATRVSLGDLPSFEFLPNRVKASREKLKEWKKFLTFLYQREKVIVIPHEEWELISKRPDVEPDERTPLRVCYRKRSTNLAQAEQITPTIRTTGAVRSTGSTHSGSSPTRPPRVQPRVGLMHPNYLQTLAQTHASWLFGGIAELVDNARDAKATRLNIFIRSVKMKGADGVIPMLGIEDDGTGMTHEDIVRMLTFGHASATDNDRDHIGHFGVGFKTGSIRIGKDAVVLTQNENSRSIGLLSTSYNAGKEVLEVPVVTYRKIHDVMELDLGVQSEENGLATLEAVKAFSPFNEFEIGSLFERIGNESSKNGTHIYIYNLDKWGSEYTLKWDAEDSKQKNSSPKDIIIRSKRARARTGQTNHEIPLDHSLRSYLAVLFLNPRMIIKVQGSKVNQTRLELSLSNTREEIKGKVLGTEVKLILGRNREEYIRNNCGIFLYWHGRLIEAYKRVGGMIHSADTGRGIIGVIDVTGLMGTENRRAKVLNTKQGFEDGEEYVMLEKWLGEVFNAYWYKYFDNIDVIGVEDNPRSFEPDREWVQCDKCRKWRKLPKGHRAEALPDNWFCYMAPFDKPCAAPEETAEDNVVTVAVNQSRQATAETKPFARKEDEIAGRQWSPIQAEEEVTGKKSSPVAPPRRLKQKLSQQGNNRPTSSSMVTRNGKRAPDESPPKIRLRRKS